MATRRALLVGINDYQYAKPLKGCENDVRDMLDVLQSRFEFTDCRLLLSAEATGVALRAALRKLIDDTEPGDTVVFFFAGHGSQMRDLDGDEPSGFDNTLVPVDSCYDEQRPELNTDVSDDEVSALLEELATKTENVTVIVDACHSGTITRGAGAMVTETRGVGPYLGPPPARASKGARAATRSAGTPYTLLASCRDTELAAEVGLPQDDGTSVKRGAFAYYLGARLRAFKTTPTARQLFEQVAVDVYDLLGGRQRPQMEGSFDRRLFGLDTDIPMPYLKVLTTVNADRCITLAAGLSLGVGEGARIAVYPPETTNVEGATPLARGTVVEVLAVRCTVQLDATDSTPAIPLTARAVIETPAPSAPQRPVRIAPVPTEGVADDTRAALETARAAMHQVLAAEPSFRLVDVTDADTLTVGFWPPATADEAWRWAVTAADGLPITPMKALGDTAALHRNCRVLTRQWLAKRLANTSPDSVLGDGRVRVEFLTAPSVKDPFAPASIGPNGLPVVRHGGMPWGLRVHNDHEEGVYVTLIDFELEGRIVQLFPPNDAMSDTPIPPKGSLEMFTQRKKKDYTLPRQYPWVADGALPARNEAVTSLRLFVSEKPVDFRFLCHDEAVRASTGDVSLAALLSQRLGVTPPTVRGSNDLEDPVDTDWTTVDVRFEVRREASAALPADVDRVLHNAGFEVRQTLEVNTRSTDGARAVQLDPVPDGYARVLLVVDENGIPQFVYPDPAGAPATRDANGTASYDFVLPETAGVTGGRSIGALLAIPQVKELLVKHIDPVFGKLGAAFAAQVESVVRPYGLRRVTGTGAPWPLMTDSDWHDMAGGRVLVLLHGWLGTGASAFGGVDAAVLTQWIAAYGGRVLAFDHPTIGHDPQRNAKELLQRIPDGTTLDVDIVALSRGGMVARVLAEEFATLGAGNRALTVRRVVQLGTPNAGTPLVGPGALKLFTNVLAGLESIEALKKMGDAAVAAGRLTLGITTGSTAELLLPLVRQAAVATVSALPGLTSLEPNSEFLTARPAIGQGATRYFAVASNVEKRDSLPFLAARMLVGSQLGGHHDLFATTESVLEAGIPFAETHTLEGDDAVTHLGLSSSPATLSTITRWLEA